MSDLIPEKKSRGLLGRDFESFYDTLENFFKGGISPKDFGIGTFKLDVQENENEYVVEADIPGVKKEELKVELDDKNLSISVEREERIDEEKKNYIHKERKSTSMSRQIYLAKAKQDGVKAKLENGVLVVTVPKEAKSEITSKIEIE